MYYVSVFGHNESPTVATTFPGELHKFEAKAELTAWLDENKARPHSEAALDTIDMFEIADGRTAVVFSGRTLPLKLRVSC